MVAICHSISKYVLQSRHAMSHHVMVAIMSQHIKACVAGEWCRCTMLAWWQWWHHCHHVGNLADALCWHHFRAEECAIAVATNSVSRPFRLQECCSVSLSSRGTPSIFSRCRSTQISAFGGRPNSAGHFGKQLILPKQCLAPLQVACRYCCKCCSTHATCNGASHCLFTPPSPHCRLLGPCVCCAVQAAQHGLMVVTAPTCIRARCICARTPVPSRQQEHDTTPSIKNSSLHVSFFSSSIFGVRIS